MHPLSIMLWVLIWGSVALGIWMLIKEIKRWGN
jgi:hypothetical protein